MGGKGNSADFSWRTEYADPKDIRFSFALPRTEEDFKRMRENHNSDMWPPTRFPSHKGYDSKYPVWGGLYNNNKPMTTQTFTGDDFDMSDASSQASSQGSTGSGSQPFKSKLTREPRVHHIPILVEARDDTGGYTFNSTHEQPSTPVQKHDQRANPPYNAHGGGHPVHITAGRSNSDQRLGPVKQPSGENNAWNEVRKSNSQPPQGSFVSKVNVNVPQPTNARVPEPQKKPQAPKVDPMKQIRDILEEMEKFKVKVDAYTGTTRDKDYRYLDEMLTRCMLKLDDVNTEGRDDIRLERKNAVRQIQNCIASLESKLNANIQDANEKRPEENGSGTNDGNDQNDSIVQ